MAKPQRRWTILFLLLVLINSLHTYEHLSNEQTNEDLTFDDEDTYQFRRKREVDSSSSHLHKRQSFGLQTVDDEDNIEGSAEAAFRTYRIKFQRSRPYLSKYADVSNPDFLREKDRIESNVKNLFNEVSGSVDVHLIRIGTGRTSQQQEVLMDLTNEAGDPYANEGAKIQRILEGAVSSRYLDAMPGSLSFSEVGDRSASRCRPDEELCPDGQCVPRCDGVRDCVSGADEMNCLFVNDTDSPKVVDEVYITGKNYSGTETTEEIDDRCPSDEKFRCKSLQEPVVIICNIQRCDGLPDCPLGEDEENCEQCPLEYNICDSNRCVLSTKWCDGFVDCKDQSDELNCPVNECRSDQFRCRDGSCIDSFRRCDYIQDCAQNEDEENCKDSCEGSGQILCDDGDTCLEDSQLCDGIADCIDGTDEANCASTTTRQPIVTTTFVTTTPAPTTTVGQICQSGQHRCNDGSCISIDLKCDGKYDCPDSSDEIDCPAKCRPDQFQCRNGDCIPMSQRCDLSYQCGDGSDEESCPTCRNNEWQCVDGSCIDKSQRCDKAFNCVDRSDEENCPGCAPGQWQCRDGNCISSASRCDRRYDCTDLSDEEDCSGLTCKDDEFSCSNDGTCIPSYMRCDGEIYCRDGSDEHNCPRPTTPSPSSCVPPKYFLCGNNYCIRHGLRCNGVQNCQDGSDEVDCPPTTCPYDEFRCDDGQCVAINKVCNGRNDCRNGEDERSCRSECDSEEFKCSNGLCIPANKRCDGVPDCPQDAGDENNCPTSTPASTLCSANEFQCTNGQCVRSQYVCDGFPDCNDSSDETQSACSARECSENEESCTDGTCISKEWICDGTSDCVDGSDEANCDTRCGVREFACESGGGCIEESLVCDRTADCQDGSDERNCVCSPSQFACKNGQCINKDAVCDRNYDCTDGSDEDNCGNCASYEFQCLSGECIYSTQRCNGNRECLDGSDEHGCSALTCRDGEEKCITSGECITRDMFCDGSYDCEDGSDEQFCPGQPKPDGVATTQTPVATTFAPVTGFLESSECSSDEFHCQDKKCIPQSSRCDGYFDCSDLSDELDCPIAQCLFGEFKCDSGECIDDSQRCNGVNDCPDASDEYDCIDYGPATTPRTICSPYEHQCDGLVCLPLNRVCDGRFDCSDRSDENRCPSTTTTTTTTPFPSRACQFNDFICTDGGCIDPRRKCDGRFDCRDQSDEQNCQPDSFLCYDGRRIPSRLRCNGLSDCYDGSDEAGCSGPTPHSPDSIDIRTYPTDQDIKESREVVFQCRDEGPSRKAVRWIREGNQRLPQGTTDIRGRLTIPNVQAEHAGVYYCEVQGVAENVPGRRKSVILRVIPFEISTHAPSRPVCNQNQATCRSGECIPKEAICDGDSDCADGSDEARCDPLGCEPNEFQCDNKQCVGKSWICDGDDDCGDGSDETCDKRAINGTCASHEFACQNADGQCVPRSFQCDNERDCFDASDEFGCSKPIVVEPPTRIIKVQRFETFTITCRAVGTPTPVIIWRLNWGHVPGSCSMTSDNGYGVLTCQSAQPSHQGAYSCEAINSLGSVFAEPDAVLTVESTDSVCKAPQFNSGAISTSDCLSCFCFGVTDECFSSDRFVSQLPPPMTDTFNIIGVNMDQFQGNYVIRDREYLLSSRFLRPVLARAAGIQLAVRDRNRLGGPSDLLVFFSLPESHKGSRLTAYGGYLRYVISFKSTGVRQPIRGPDVILRGNNITIMHSHDYTYEADKRNQIDVRFWPGNWYKRVINRGGRIQSQEPAGRRDIMTVLENIDLFLIRASYVDGTYIDTTLNEIQLDTAVFKETKLGQAIYVEECRCPPGYTGSSCEDCAPNYRRTLDGPFLGSCVLDVGCGPDEYGDPSNGIPCLPCPCPLTNQANRFSQSCYLDSDGQVTCNCLRGYSGRRCETCAEGYEGNPALPGDSCQPAGECDSRGSVRSLPNPRTGLCECKQYVSGPKCSQCSPGTFHLDTQNQFGCIQCFCSGVTNVCTSSNWYRNVESINFVNSIEGMQLVDQFQRNVIKNNLFADTGRQELVFREFSELTPDVYYWKLPAKFIGNKINSYGGNLTYTLRYIPSPGGQSSRNNAYDVEIFGNDIKLWYYGRQKLQASTLDTISVPFYEQYWQLQDGQVASRERLLTALAGLEYVLIKATFTTNTQEVGLKNVEMEIAQARNTGRQRAFSVEMCDCPEGYRGLSCEVCDIGYKRSFSGFQLGRCEKCECNGHSIECDSVTGRCFNCRDNRGGDYCDRCADGYFMNNNGVCERSEPCSCDPRGSVSSQCSDDKCQCKANVEGDDCNTCRQGHFFLSDKNENGCLRCWCSGVTSQCSSLQYYRELIPMNLFPGHGFTLADRSRVNVINEGLETDVPENRITYSRFDQLPGQTTFYWSLPQIFTGNRLTSYGGQLSVTQYFDSRSTTDIYADADIVITSGEKREFIWMNRNPLKPRQTQTYVVRLVESEFTVDQRPATRREFLAALSNIEAVLIRAQFSESMVSSSLQYVTMETAVEYQTAQQKALEVEHCRCPKEYIGFSCEECAQGYYRDITSSSCLRCPCNGKEESCQADRSGNVTCKCLAGFSGRNCGVSVNEPPGGGTLNITITREYYEVQVGATIEMKCTSKADSRISFVWDRQGGKTLPYGRASDNRQGLLLITQVRPEDAGYYICRGSNGIVVDEATTELIVSGGSRPSKPVVIIDDQRKEVRINIGQRFEIRCRVSGNPTPEIQWVREDGRQLPQSVQVRDGLLTFVNPQISDAGTYVCRGQNSRGVSSSTVIIYVGEEYLSTARPETTIIVRVSEEDVQRLPGEVVRVTCFVPDTEFRATITWTREQGELPRKAYQRESELVIPDAQPVDSGLYTCRVRNELGFTGQATTRVNIATYSDFPEVRVEPDRQTVHQGKFAQIRCIASGTPKPTIKWTKINEEIGRNVAINGDVLRIESADVTDRGMYLCEATNDAGMARAASILEVERREPPVIEMYPDTRQTIERGSSAMFQCYLKGGIPSPTVSWVRSDGKPLSPNAVALSGGVLKFTSVTGEEEGSYICTAVNDAGRMTATATLEIQSVPVITLSPFSSPVRVQVGHQLLLQCFTEGDPTPSAHWEKIGGFTAGEPVSSKPVGSSAIYKIERTTQSDQGTYECRATNAVGSSIERIQVIIEDSLPGHVPGATDRPPQPSRPGTESYQVPLGGDFKFRCYAESTGDEREDKIYDFIRTDGRPLPRGHTEIDGILSLSNIDQTAGGEYACIVKERITQRVLITIYATVEVLEQPRVRLEPARQVVKPGDIVSLRCIVTGAQPITINWSKQRGPMPPSVIIDGGELLFQGIATTDAGRYLCEAVNNVGRAASIAEVVVNERPLLTALQSDVAVSQGQNVDLRCEMSGVNPALVRWTQNGRELPRNAYVLPSNAILRITNAQPDNAGRYKCEANTGLGSFTYDFITLTVHSSRQVDVRIQPSSRNVRIGDPLELICVVVGQSRPIVSWSRQGAPLPYNARVEGRTLRIANVQPNNGGVYTCTVTTSSGVFEENYPLAISNIAAVGHNSRSVRTRSTKFGAKVQLECDVELAPTVTYTWTKLADQLPERARIKEDTIEIPETQADDAGTYVCTAENDSESKDSQVLLIVTGVVPRFSGNSYLALPTLPDAYLFFDLEISFKPEDLNGLILYNSQRDGPGDFISFGLVNGMPEFRFDVGSGPAIIKSDQRLELNEWHSVKLSRNRKEGTMIINGGAPIMGKSEGKFQGLDLINSMYIGGVPDPSTLNDESVVKSGFKGCISRLVIGLEVIELMRDARSMREVEPCDTCTNNPCQNGGICQDSYSPKGHKCLCSSGFSGEFCESTGESCYPGVCGTGECMNVPDGIECLCPFGSAGPRCDQSIDITEPSFARDAYAAFPTPRALKRFSVVLEAKPETQNDGILMYSGQQEKGDGDFASLAIKNGRIEFKFNTGSGTATLTSKETATPGEWIAIHANRTNKMGSLRINDGNRQNAQSPGPSRSLNLRTPLYVGGVDKTKISVAKDVGVVKGFTGCIKNIEIMYRPINIADTLEGSANVDQCGVSPCDRNPCMNGGVCADDPSTQLGFFCACPAEFGGPRCRSRVPEVCVNEEKCHNEGTCKRVSNSASAIKECFCPLGYAGPNCEHETYLGEMTSYDGHSWAEMDRFLLPQDGISEQEITLEFSTIESEGLLFWLGQEPTEDGTQKDFLSIGVVDGYVDFTFQMDGELVSARSEYKVNDGLKHTVTTRRQTNMATLLLDNFPSVVTEGSQSLFSFNTLGNIYIGGTPNMKMTGGRYDEGFRGCIVHLKVGSNFIDNFLDYALKGENVIPCSSE